MKRYIKIFYILSLTALSALIFSFSSQTGETSGGISEKVADVAVEVINIGKERINPSHESTDFQSLHTLVRKTAHFSIYAALGFCAFGFIMSTRLAKHKKLAVFLSLTFCILYACSDEFHQSFVAGRGPAITDVLIDSAGAIVGIMLQLILIKLIFAFKSRNYLP